MRRLRPTSPGPPSSASRSPVTPLAHMLCHFVLPYSNWQWTTVCFSESLMALRRGVQSAVFRLGCVPVHHQTDNSTAATHELPDRRGKRAFNEEYVRGDGAPRHEAADDRCRQERAERRRGSRANGALKRRLEQHLLLRVSRDFPSLEAYERWGQDVCDQANRLRDKRLGEELAKSCPALRVDRLPEYSRRGRDRDVVGARFASSAAPTPCPRASSVSGFACTCTRTGSRSCMGPVLQLVTERLRGGWQAPHQLPPRHRLPGAQARRL